MNAPEHWGPSDHCQVRIMLDEIGGSGAEW